MIAYDGEQGLRLLNELNFKPDFILLDLNLPKFSGLELLERYHAKEGPPLIVLSGSDNPTEKERAMELGARDYVQKPLAWPDFIQAVHDVMMRWAGHGESAA
jgi:DNA-binding response OmpR family regulator